MEWVMLIFIYFGLISHFGLINSDKPVFYSQTFCFDDYNLDEPELVHAHLACLDSQGEGKSDLYKMEVLNMEYSRPSEAGDTPCIRNKDAECCEEWVNDTIQCVVQVDRVKIQQMLGECLGQSHCQTYLEPRNLRTNCGPNCTVSSEDGSDWCWSRLLTVEYYCYKDAAITEMEHLSNTYIILLCVLVPLFFLLGIGITLLILKIRNKGYINSDCFSKKMSDSTPQNLSFRSSAVPRIPSQPNNYMMERGATAAGIRHQNSNFSNESSLYCVPEDLVPRRDGLNEKNRLVQGAYLSATGHQDIPEERTEAKGSRNKSSAKVSFKEHRARLRRQSSEESGIEFNVPPPNSIRKVSLVKEMIDNPFYKSLGELSKLAEEEGLSQFGRGSSNTVDVDTGASGVGAESHWNRSVECNTGKPIDYVSGKQDDHSKPSQSYHDCDKSRANHETDVLTNDHSKNTDRFLDVPHQNENRSASPGSYVKFSAEKSLSDVQQFEPVNVNSNVVITTNDQVILPLRKRSSKQATDETTNHLYSPAGNAGFNQFSSSESDSDASEQTNECNNAASTANSNDAYHRDNREVQLPSVSSSHRASSSDESDSDSLYHSDSLEKGKSNPSVSNVNTGKVEMEHEHSADYNNETKSETKHSDNRNYVCAMDSMIDSANGGNSFTRFDEANDIRSALAKQKHSPNGYEEPTHLKQDNVDTGDTKALVSEGSGLDFRRHSDSDTGGYTSSLNRRLDDAEKSTQNPRMLALNDHSKENIFKGADEDHSQNDTECTKFHREEKAGTKYLDPGNEVYPIDSVIDSGYDANCMNSVAETNVEEQHSENSYEESCYWKKANDDKALEHKRECELSQDKLMNNEADELQLPRVSSERLSSSSDESGLDSPSHSDSDIGGYTSPLNRRSDDAERNTHNQRMMDVNDYSKENSFKGVDEDNNIDSAEMKHEHLPDETECTKFHREENAGTKYLDPGNEVYPMDSVIDSIYDASYMKSIDETDMKEQHSHNNYEESSHLKHVNGDTGDRKTLGSERMDEHSEDQLINIETEELQLPRVSSERLSSSSGESGLDSPSHSDSDIGGYTSPLNNRLDDAEMVTQNPTIPDLDDHSNENFFKGVDEDNDIRYSDMKYLLKEENSGTKHLDLANEAYPMDSVIHSGNNGNSMNSVGEACVKPNHSHNNYEEPNHLKQANDVTGDIAILNEPLKDQLFKTEIEELQVPRISSQQLYSSSNKSGLDSPCNSNSDIGTYTLPLNGTLHDEESEDDETRIPSSDDILNGNSLQTDDTVVTHL